MDGLIYLAPEALLYRRAIGSRVVNQADLDDRRTAPGWRGWEHCNPGIDRDRSIVET